MKITITVITDYGKKYTNSHLSLDDLKTLSFHIDNNADIIVYLNEEFIFKTNCLEFKKAINAFDI